MASRGLAILQSVLTASVARKGEVPLTNAHLLNIVKMARRVESRVESRYEVLCSRRAARAYDEAIGEDRKWGR